MAKKAMKKSCKPVTRMINDIGLSYARVLEMGIEPFEELAKKNPEEAVKQFPAFMDKVLSMNNGLFSGVMCGGPDYVVLGDIYPRMKGPVRTMAFQKVLGYLDGLNYINSQNHVERIPEPHLLRDIIINRWLYWPGYKFYTDSLQEAATWKDFEGNIANVLGVPEEKQFMAPSLGWMGFALARKDTYRPDVVQEFSRQFPELSDRVKDFVGGLIVGQAMHHVLKQRKEEKREGRSYGAFIEEKLTHYIEPWQSAIYERTRQQGWLLLPDSSVPAEAMEAIYKENNP
jgi:hypothetical protein